MSSDRHYKQPSSPLTWSDIVVLLVGHRCASLHGITWVPAERPDMYPTSMRWDWSGARYRSSSATAQGLHKRPVGHCLFAPCLLLRSPKKTFFFTLLCCSGGLTWTACCWLATYIYRNSPLIHPCAKGISFRKKPSTCYTFTLGCMGNISWKHFIFAIYINVCVYTNIWQKHMSFFLSRILYSAVHMNRASISCVVG